MLTLAVEIAMVLLSLSVNIVVFTGVLTVHAKLNVPEAATVEAQLEARLRECREWMHQATPEEQQGLLITLDAVVIGLTKSNSVAVFIHCSTLAAVQFLNRSLEDGTLKSVLEGVFSMLLKGRHCEIRQLQCRVTNYNSCLNYFYKSLGLLTIIFIF